MNKFNENIINLFGKKGEQWLTNLPQIINALAEHWGLSELWPYSNLSYNYVVRAMNKENIPVVVKISYEQQLMEDESKALQHFAGHGAIKLLDTCGMYNAMLLCQAIPGDSLKTYYPSNLAKVITIYSDVINKLIDASDNSTQLKFKSVVAWLNAFERVSHESIPSGLFQYANQLQRHLLNTADKTYVLHGDLHHDNIIIDDDHWLAIDPKGIVGEKAFEAAAFDFVYSTEYHSKQEYAALLKTRVELLAQILNLDAQRLLQWVFIRLLLSALWFIEDSGDPGEAIFQASAIYENIYL